MQPRAVTAPSGGGPHRDSGIGGAVALLYAREGVDVAIVHFPEEQSDADETRREIEATGRTCLLLPGDLCDPQFCREAVERPSRRWAA